MIIIIQILCGHYVFAQSKNPFEIMDFQGKNIETENFYIIEKNFESIVEGDTLESLFLFRNNGNIPIEIYSVNTNCPCFEATSVPKLIMPGKIDSIKTIFYSWNRKGVRNQRLFLKTSIVPKPIVLNLSGIVEENGNTELNIPITYLNFKGRKTKSVVIDYNPLGYRIMIKHKKKNFGKDASINIFSQEHGIKYNEYIDSLSGNEVFIVSSLHKINFRVEFIIAGKPKVIRDILIRKKSYWRE